MSLQSGPKCHSKVDPLLGIVLVHFGVTKLSLQSGPKHYPKVDEDVIQKMKQNVIRKWTTLRGFGPLVCDILVHMLLTFWSTCDILVHLLVTFWSTCDILVHLLVTFWSTC